MPVGRMADPAALVTGGTQDVGEAVRDAIAAQVCPALYVQTDLSVVAQCHAAGDRTVERLGRLDALANCAGRTDCGSLRDTTEEIWDTLFDTNVRGPQMRRQGDGGSIVVIGSMQVYGGAPFLLPYAATKGCLRTCAFLLSGESGTMSGAIIDYDQQVIGPMQDNPGL